MIFCYSRSVVSIDWFGSNERKSVQLKTKGLKWSVKGLILSTLQNGYTFYHSWNSNLKQYFSSFMQTYIRFLLTDVQYIVNYVLRTVLSAHYSKTWKVSKKEIPFCLETQHTLQSYFCTSPNLILLLLIADFIPIEHSLLQWVTTKKLQKQGKRTQVTTGEDIIHLSRLFIDFK